MKSLLSSALLVTFLATPLLPLETLEARDRERLSSRANVAYQRVARTITKKPSKRAVRPFDRAILNNTVYRYEGNPNIRHEERSSPEVMFHLDNRRVATGHAWDN